MSTRFSLGLYAGLGLCMGGLFAFCDDQFASSGVEIAAAGALGRGEVAVLQLVRELTSWKARAERAERLLTASGIPAASEHGAMKPTQAHVLSVLESERVVILSAGRLSGAVLGSLVSVGDGVLAKVVESRETVSAAVVDQGYRGKVGSLHGCLVRLLVRA